MRVRAELGKKASLTSRGLRFCSIPCYIDMHISTYFLMGATLTLEGGYRQEAVERRDQRANWDGQTYLELIPQAAEALETAEQYLCAVVGSLRLQRESKQ